MQIREAKKAMGHAVDANWEAVVGLSEPASVAHDGEDGSDIQEKGAVARSTGETNSTIKETDE
jgi:hypothetical protein